MFKTKLSLNLGMRTVFCDVLVRWKVEKVLYLLGQQNTDTSFLIQLHIISPHDGYLSW